MELIYGIAGGIVLYSWIHSIVIISRKVSGTTRYEKVVLWAGLVLLILFWFGTLAE